jgi:phosphotriesterase-related protein
MKKTIKITEYIYAMIVRNQLFVINVFIFLLFGCYNNPPESALDEPKIFTVQGPIHPDSLGVTLIHEHVFLDWSGADNLDPTNWDLDEAEAIILPFLQRMKARGVKSFLECTPAYLGRSPQLLKRLASETGLQILTNTGFYAARENQHIPEFVDRISADSLASMWVNEFENGIEGTNVRPGFIKIGMDSKEPLSEIDKKLVEAAARTHLNTGLTIVSHTGTDTTAAQQMQILGKEGVAPDAFVWTHAQNGTAAGHVRLASKGAWISLDGMGWIRPDAETGDSSALFRYLDFLINLKQNSLLNRTLISHDAGWYTVGQEDQTGFKPYTDIFDLVVPRLIHSGMSAEEVKQLLVENPKNAFMIRKRPLDSQ